MHLFDFLNKFNFLINLKKKNNKKIKESDYVDIN